MESRAVVQLVTKVLKVFAEGSISQVAFTKSWRKERVQAGTDDRLSLEHTKIDMTTVLPCRGVQISSISQLYRNKVSDDVNSEPAFTQL